jgi:ABC-type antimicrobial peptide transport system permease subunit
MSLRHFTIWHDGRFAVRTLWKNRIFAATAILTFALGIGATTAIFTIQAYLFQVAPTEITTFAAVAVGFVVVASASAYLPLRRATRIDPMTVLRHD